GGWLTGRYRKGQEPPASTRAARIPRRFDLSLLENQRKLEAADALAVLAEEAGLTLIHMALAFVLRHPAVSAAIIGPRTMEQLESQLGTDEVTLSDELLDRIDEIVAPGTNFNPDDAGYTSPALEGGRCVQAAGGALVVTAALDLLSETTGSVARAARVWVAAGVFGAVLGPAIGGVLTQTLGWQAIFLAQVPTILVPLAALRGV